MLRRLAAKRPLLLLHNAYAPFAISEAALSQQTVTCTSTIQSAIRDSLENGAASGWTAFSTISAAASSRHTGSIRATKAAAAFFSDPASSYNHPASNFALFARRRLSTQPPGSSSAPQETPTHSKPALQERLEQQQEDLEAQHGPPIPPPQDSLAHDLVAPFSASSVAEAGAILQHANVAHLREELAALSERQATVPYSQLLELCIQTGAAGGQQEAERLAAALCASGVVMRFRQKVYLRPDEVAHSVLQSLPDTLEDLTAKEAELEAQLAPLAERKQKIDAAAHRRSKAVMWLGFSLLVGQWGVFYWLTWYELSWDVMEPVAYFVSLGTAIAFYLYFLLTNEAFDYQPLQQRLFSRWQHIRLQKSGFNKETHDRLAADLARYRRYIAHFKRA